MNEPNYDINEYEFPPKDYIVKSNSFKYSDINYDIYESDYESDLKIPKIPSKNFYSIFNNFGGEFILNKELSSDKRSIFLCMSKPKSFKKITLTLSNIYQYNFILKIYGSDNDPLNNSSVTWLELGNYEINIITKCVEYYTISSDMEFNYFKLDFESLSSNQILTISKIKIFFTQPIITYASGEFAINSANSNDTSFHFGNKKNCTISNNIKTDSNDKSNDLVFSLANLNDKSNDKSKNEVLRLLNTKNKASVSIGTPSSENNRLKVCGGISLDFINKSDTKKKSYIGITNTEDGENLKKKFNGIIFNNTPTKNYISFALSKNYSTTNSITDPTTDPITKIPKSNLTKELLKIDDNGYVGIGNNSNMKYQLDVKFDYFSNSNGKYFIETDTEAGAYFKSLQYKYKDKTPVSINTNGAIMSEYGFISKADSRIRKTSNEIPSLESLYKMTKLNLFSYDFIADKDISTGNETGFDVQNIEENIPDAVTNISEYVPIPYKLYSINSNDNFDDNSIEFTIKVVKSSNLIIMKYSNFSKSDTNFRSDLKTKIDSTKSSLRLKMYLKFEDISINNVEVYGEAKYDTTIANYFIINITLIDFDLLSIYSNINEIFIWGYLTDDFKTIEKDYIYNTGIASIKHLTDINYTFHEIDKSEEDQWTDDSIGSIVYLGTKITERIIDATIEIPINKDNFTVNPETLYNNTLIIKFNGIITMEFSNDIKTLENMLNSSSNSNKEFRNISQINANNIIISAKIKFSGKIQSISITGSNYQTTTNNSNKISFKNNSKNIIDTSIDPGSLNINGNFDGILQNNNNNKYITNISNDLSFPLTFFIKDYIDNNDKKISDSAKFTVSNLSIIQTKTINSSQTKTINSSQTNQINPAIISNQANPSQANPIQANPIQANKLLTSDPLLNIDTNTNTNTNNIFYSTTSINYAYENYYTGTVCDIIKKSNYKKIVVIANKGVVKLMYYIKDIESLTLKYGDLLCTSPEDIDKSGFVIKQSDNIIKTNTVAKCLMDINFDKNAALKKFIIIYSLLI
jgi:hypothetical protein